LNLVIYLNIIHFFAKLFVLQIRFSRQRMSIENGMWSYEHCSVSQ